MAHVHTDADGTEVFCTPSRLPVAGAVGYTVRVLPSHPLLSGGAELGLVTLA
nr:glycogen phosphorylase GlgP [Mycolicibacter nonchromogenicus]